MRVVYVHFALVVVREEVGVVVACDFWIVGSALGSLDSLEVSELLRNLHVSYVEQFFEQRHVLLYPNMVVDRWLKRK